MECRLFLVVFFCLFHLSSSCFCSKRRKRKTLLGEVLDNDGCPRRECDEYLATLPPYIGHGRYDEERAKHLGRLFPRNSASGHPRLNMGFEEWEEAAQEDGFICRRHGDCDWIEPRLYCQTYEITLRRPWFGLKEGTPIEGYCACPVLMEWDEEQLTCVEATSYEWMWILLKIFAVIGMFIVFSLIVYFMYKNSYLRHCLPF